jgi:hypothetical protein
MGIVGLMSRATGNLAGLAIWKSSRSETTPPSRSKHGWSRPSGRPLHLRRPGRPSRLDTPMRCYDRAGSPFTVSVWVLRHPAERSGMRKRVTRRAAILWVIGALLPCIPVQADTPSSKTGTVTSRPEGRSGDWLVGGTTFKATSVTQVDEARGPAVVDSCVTVRYVVSDGTNLALKVGTEDKEACQ